MIKRISAVLGVTGVCVLALNASANTTTFETPIGASTGGGSVDATAKFTTTSQFGGAVTVVLTDLLINPKDAAQLLSDIEFTLSNGSHTGIIDPNISHSFSTLRNVLGDGTFTGGETIFPFGWQLNLGATDMEISALGGGQPKQLLIGPPDGSNLYSAANSSIAGNKPHNPFLANTLMFTITNVPGVTDATIVQTATFSFGTEAGINITGVHRTTAVPDAGTTVALLGLGLSGLGLLRRKLS